MLILRFVCVLTVCIQSQEGSITWNRMMATKRFLAKPAGSVRYPLLWGEGTWEHTVKAASVIQVFFFLGGWASDFQLNLNVGLNALSSNLFPSKLLYNFFLSHRKKRMRQLQKKIKSGTLNIKEDDPFELFIAATNIRYCYYNETHKILGNTFGMCVLQVRS